MTWIEFAVVFGALVLVFMVGLAIVEFFFSLFPRGPGGMGH